MQLQMQLSEKGVAKSCERMMENSVCEWILRYLAEWVWVWMCKDNFFRTTGQRKITQRGSFQLLKITGKKWVCVFVSKHENEREKERKKSECVCVRAKWVCVFVSKQENEREKERKRSECVCVRAREWERERERYNPTFDVNNLELQQGLSEEAWVWDKQLFPLEASLLCDKQP